MVDIRFLGFSPLVAKRRWGYARTSVMIELLQESQLLLLFFVTAVGYAIGRLRIFGFQLGVAAVLFVGLYFGSIDPNLTLPSFVSQLGLVIFVYAIGLSNGASFFSALQKNANVNVFFIVLSVVIPALLLVPFYFLTMLDASTIGGIFAGSQTNTPALAGVLDIIETTLTGRIHDQEVARVVIGYSLSYPIGVVGRMVSLALAQRFWRVDFAAEAEALKEEFPVARTIVNRSIKVTNAEATGRSLRDLKRVHRWNVLFGRLSRANQISLIGGDTVFQLGDVVAIAGEEEDSQDVIGFFGKPSEEDITIDQTVYEKRRLFVSNPEVAGKSLISLDLRESYGALVTRVRRGDIDLLAKPDTVLELGDRVRVLAHRNEMQRLVDLFGDSYVAVSGVNLLSLGFGVTMGLLLGMINLTFPGGFEFRLGFAGGPLVVAVILGALRRTGPLVWSLPYSSNQTLQQLGLILLLAGVGVSAGNSLEDSLLSITSLVVLGASFVAVLGTMWLGLVIGYRLLRIPFSLVSGILASQPAVLNYMTERSGNQLPQIGFTMALPIGIILKVALAQLLYLLLG